MIDTEALAKKLLTLTPDEILVMIRKATLRGESDRLLRVFVVAYEAVCEQRLKIAMSVEAKNHD